MKYLILVCLGILCGCHEISQPGLEEPFVILGPSHVTGAASSDTIRLSPDLRITNLTNAVLGIAYFGAQIKTSQLSYRLTDAHQKEIPLLRRDFLGSTLAGMRIGVTLLQRGQFVQWTPNEALIYPKPPKGRYWLVAHVEIPPLDRAVEAGLSDGERFQSDQTRHAFDSKPLEISVE